MSLDAVFNDATLTGADQSPNVSARRGEVPGAAVYEASRHSSIKDRLMVPPPVLGVGSVPHICGVNAPCGQPSEAREPTYTRRRRRIQ
jgi:hypothetical protein